MYLKSILNKVSKKNVLQVFSLLFILKSLEMVKIKRFFLNSNWKVPKTPSKMHMYDLVKIDQIVFAIVGGGG